MSIFNKIDKIIKHNIKGIPPGIRMTASFGAQLEASKLVKVWKDNPLTLSSHIDCKRRSVAKGLSEFRDLYNVSEFYIEYKPQTEFYKDDCIEIHYRKKN